MSKRLLGWFLRQEREQRGPCDRNVHNLKESGTRIAQDPHCADHVRRILPDAFAPPIVARHGNSRAGANEPFGDVV